MIMTNKIRDRLIHWSRLPPVQCFDDDMMNLSVFVLSRGVRLVDKYDMYRGLKGEIYSHKTIKRMFRDKVMGRKCDDR